MNNQSTRIETDSESRRIHYYPISLVHQNSSCLRRSAAASSDPLTTTPSTPKRKVPSLSFSKASATTTTTPQLQLQLPYLPHISKASVSLFSNIHVVHSSKHQSPRGATSSSGAKLAHLKARVILATRQGSTWSAGLGARATVRGMPPQASASRAKYDVCAKADLVCWE